MRLKNSQICWIKHIGWNKETTLPKGLSHKQTQTLKVESLNSRKIKKNVNKAHEDNKQFETIFVDLSKKKHDLKTKILELHNWLKILKSEEKNIRASTTSNTKLENDIHDWNFEDVGFIYQWADKKERKSRTRLGFHY